MSFFTILETLLIGPLKLVFEIVFNLAERLMSHPGKAIIVFSLIMNIMVLPLYRRADAMQDKARDDEARLQKGVSHIKKTFSGDERMMILQAYYRQNNYKPTDALNGSVSLLLEIPFFMAAYQFLSGLETLQGVSLGPIANLGVPDAMIVIGGLTINLLPVLMTLINVISSALYLKGHPLKTKIQLYAMALFFLFFLYDSPSGLVFYWTLNNVFSLVKTIFYKLKNPRRVLAVICSLLGATLLVLGLAFHLPKTTLRRYFSMSVGLMLQLPLIIIAVKSRLHLHRKASRFRAQPNRALFVMGGVFLTVLTGLLIPSTFIAASPQEFVDVTNFYNPLFYILFSVCYAAGTFMIWLRIFYWIASSGAKVIMDRLVWIFCGAALVNYMFFGTKLGIISPNLQYENGMRFARSEIMINVLVMVLVAAVLYIFVCTRWRKAAVAVLLTASIALGCMSGVNVVNINRSIGELPAQEDQIGEFPGFTISRNGKNVVVIMLDRALGVVVPYVLNEKPELKSKFAGFTYYDNVISFGRSTIFGAPALYGGYEYTPVELNKRSTERLVDKHNEALKVMPVLFSENGYDVTVFAPAYANFQWIPDLSIFDDYPEIKTANTYGRFVIEEQKEFLQEDNRRNFFCFGLMKSLPVVVQPLLYLKGTYGAATSTQIQNDMSTASGYYGNYLADFNVLTNLGNMTDITDEETNTFLSMCNNSTHNPILLQEPEYEPALQIDNHEYDAAHADRFILNKEDGGSSKLNVNNTMQMIHYHCAMDAFIELGKWFDYLRENDVYDNTRIILVADHGHPLGMSDELLLSGEENMKDVMSYFPLLMMKDFDSHEFTVSSEFMTNGDVPTLATENLIEDARNPFTGNPINSDEKTAHDQLVMLSRDWDPRTNNRETFLPASWASISGNIWDSGNWSFYMEKTVLDEHVLPEAK